jgi:Tol biopolymer transport system component
MNAAPRPHLYVFFRSARLMVLAYLLGVLLIAAPAEAAWPGKDGALAFTRDQHIWIELPSGKQRQLTWGQWPDDEPTFSPDGRTIAFTRHGHPDSEIWLMNSDGTNKRPLTDTATSEAEPAFFPSGRSLVFATLAGSPGRTIFSIKTDGTGLRQLAETARYPVISPDGRWLAFSQRGGSERIRLENLHSGEERELESGFFARELEFSPDGRRLAFTSQLQCGRKEESRRAILTMGLSAKRPRVLLSCSKRFVPFGPAWSPRGDRIVFSRLERGEHGVESRLAFLNANGSLVAGAPLHRARTSERSPSWQPLPLGSREDR